MWAVLTLSVRFQTESKMDLYASINMILQKVEINHALVLEKLNYDWQIYNSEP